MINSIIFIPLIFVAGSFGAYANFLVRKGVIGGWLSILSTFISAILWLGMVKYAKGTIINSSMIYDVAMSTSYIIVLLFLGERMSFVQYIGLSISFIGLCLMQIK